MPKPPFSPADAPFKPEDAGFNIEAVMSVIIRRSPDPSLTFLQLPIDVQADSSNIEGRIEKGSIPFIEGRITGLTFQGKKIELKASVAGEDSSGPSPGNEGGSWAPFGGSQIGSPPPPRPRNRQDVPAGALYHEHGEGVPDMLDGDYVACFATSDYGTFKICVRPDNLIKALKRMHLRDGGGELTLKELEPLLYISPSQKDDLAAIGKP